MLPDLLCDFVLVASLEILRRLNRTGDLADRIAEDRPDLTRRVGDDESIAADLIGHLPVNREGSL